LDIRRAASVSYKPRTGKNGKLLKFDRLDWELLDALELDSRLSLKGLGKKLGRPPSTLFERLKRLRETGVIKRFTVQRDWDKLGFKASAFILTKFDPASELSQKEVAKKLQKFLPCRKCTSLQASTTFF